MINWTIPVIIPPIYPPIVDGVDASRGTLYAHQTIASENIVTDAARRGACVSRYPTAVNQRDTDEKIPQDANTSRIPPVLTSPVCICCGPSVSPTRTGSQKIISPSSPISPVEVRNAQPFHTSINGIMLNMGTLRQL